MSHSSVRTKAKLVAIKDEMVIKEAVQGFGDYALNTFARDWSKVNGSIIQGISLCTILEYRYGMCVFPWCRN